MRIDVPKSATDVMHDVIFAAVVDAIGALRAASGNVPNTLLRDVNTIHANTTYADLPKPVQDAIAASTRAAFTRLLKEGYAVAPGTTLPPRPVAPRDPSNRPPTRTPPRDGERRPPTRKPGDRPRPPSDRPRPPGGRPPRRGGPKPG